MSHPGWQSVTRILKYALIRGLSLLLAVTVSVWLTVIVAGNSGVLESEIRGSKIGGWFSGIMGTGTTAPPEGFVPYQGTLAEQIDLVVRGLTFNLGDTYTIYLYRSGGIYQEIQGMILDFLSRTLLLFGTANLLLFFLSISIALLLYRNYGSFFDRLVVTLSPLSSVPAWIYGLALVVFAARVFHYFPNTLFDQWPEKFTWSWLGYLGKSLFLPILAIFLSKFFQSIYLWRTFFLSHATEDYVEMAKAKGLAKNIVDRQYVMRPALPSLLTSFATMITGIWQEAIILELFFGVAGIGHLFYNALRFSRTEMPLLIGLTVTFAYMLAVSVFILDIVYVLVDPRVRFIGQRVSTRPSRRVPLKVWLRNWKGLFHREKTAVIPQQMARGGGQRWSRRDILPEMGFGRKLLQAFKGTWQVVWELRRYPSAVFGLLIVLLMVGASIYTVTAYPYKTTIAQWRSEGNVWDDYPKQAGPVWLNWFRIRKLSESKVLNTEDGTASKEVGVTENEMTPVRMEFVFDYPYDDFPTELNLRVKTKTVEKNVFFSPTWIMPDGREVRVGNFSTRKEYEERHLLLYDVSFHRNANQTPKVIWFSVKDSDPPVTLKGQYILRLDAFLFEPEADVEAEVLLHGQLYGLAGTDIYRRDLLLPLLWGTPIALTFGLVGALLASLMTMTLAAIGTWFGGWVDGLIQRLTEVNMVLPAFPLLVLVYISVSKNVWVILGLAVLLNMMNNAIKNYRAAFMQIRESGYIEAAQAYGASNGRIIFHYLIPRILPVLVPQLVSLAPGLVFLEATLAYLNISDPSLPTWGKLIQESISNGALNGAYYQVVEPVALLLITGLALSMIGFALDRILNPRLREI